MLRLLFALLMVAGLCLAEEEVAPPVDYTTALNIIERDYENRRDEYNMMYKTPLFHWEFINYDSFPFGCSEFDFGEDSAVIEWVWMYGPCVALINGDPVHIQIPVMSFIKKEDPPNTRVYRMYFLKKNSKGKWFQSQNSVRVEENWNGEMYVCKE